MLPNWGLELQRWLPAGRFQVVMYEGRPEERKQLQQQVRLQGCHVLLTHYDLALRDKAFLRKLQWEYCIVDEGHRLKNTQSRLGEVLRALDAKRRLLLTGTPIQNTVGELWALMNFLLPSVFDSTAAFEEWLAGGLEGASGDELALQEEEELLLVMRLQEVIRPFMIRRTKGEVETQLPAKTDAVLRVDLSAWQQVLLRQIQEGKAVRSQGGASGRNKVSLRNTLVHLRKACNHPFLFLDDLLDLRPEDLVRTSGKLQLLHHLLPKLQRTGHRVLLFTQMTRVLDLLEDYLQHLGQGLGEYLRLDGGTKTEDRARLIQHFNSGGPFLFLLSTRAGGLGLNLQTADTVIFFDSDWNPQMDLQAQDRAHRIGQTRDVKVLVLVSAGTVEEVILDRASEKKGLDAKIIQAGLFNQKSTEEERRQALQAILGGGGMQWGEGAHSLDEVNELVARTPEELEVFRQVDRELQGQWGDLPPLMQEAEVPAWVTAESEPEANEAAEEEPEPEEEGGTRRRPRRRTVNANVRYVDELDDKVLESFFASDSSSEEEAGAGAPRRERSARGRKQGRRTADGEQVEEGKRRPRKQARLEQEAEEEEEEGEEQQVEEDQSDPSPSARGRSAGRRGEDVGWERCFFLPTVWLMQMLRFRSFEASIGRRPQPAQPDARVKRRRQRRRGSSCRAGIQEERLHDSTAQIAEAIRVGPAGTPEWLTTVADSEQVGHARDGR